MVRFGRILPTLVVSLATILWAAPPPAQATFELRIYEDGNIASPLLSLQDSDNDGSIAYTGNVGTDFNLAFTFATSNSPGDSDVGIVTVSNTRITNLTGATHSLTIAVSSQGFMSPSGSGLTLVNTTSGSVTRGTISGNFTTYVDQGNGLFGMSDIQTAAVTFSQTTGTSFAGTTLQSPLTLAGPYSITNVGNYTFGASASMTLTGGNSQVQAPDPSSTTGGTGGVLTPAPSGLVLALTGMPLFSLGCWFRARRRNDAQ